MNRIISWYSCGAASAVATKLAISEGLPVTVVYCEVKEEHPDNARFLRDCEEWFGQKIQVMGNDKYDRSIYAVFNKTNFLSHKGIARCTVELKKQVRKNFERHDDVQIFGYTVEEQRRVDRFIDSNNEVDFRAPLIERGLTKSDCLAMIENAGIELPAMYKLGYKNNNCRGCVKAESPRYWAKIRKDFPLMFDAMAAQEIRQKWPICSYQKNGERHRPFLVDLPDDVQPMDDSEDIQCGIFCHMAESEYTA